MESPSNTAGSYTSFENFLPPSPLGLSVYSGTWDTPQVTHLLKRCLFGTTVADINYFKTMTMQQAVAQLLQPTPAPTSLPLNNYGTDPTGVASWAPWFNVGLLYSNPQLNESRLNSLQCWWTGQMLSPGRSIHEKMTLFWHNHFAMDATQHFSDIPAQLWYNQYMTLRQNALGNFQTLVKAITLDPAMLIFLNGSTNVATSPNENYGRELQELYTVGLGIGNQTTYSQNDVHAAARVLTGHTIDLNYNYTFLPGNHDALDKNFSSFYANHVVTGYSGAAGAGELDDMLAMIFATPESAKFICRKIYNFFVYYDIDSSVEANIITPLATIFQQSGYNISAVLSALLQSQHFFDLANSGACIIKSPLDLLIGLCREYDLPLPTASNPAAQYAVWNMLLQRAIILQQEVMAITLVAGWPAYYQAPQYHELWINSVTYSARNFYTDLLIGTGDMMNGTSLQIDAIHFASLTSNPSDPNQLIADSLNVLLQPPISASNSTLIKQTILLSGQTNDYYWTQAWQNYQANPSDMTAFTTVDSRLRALYKYLMDLPEYQLS